MKQKATNIIICPNSTGLPYESSADQNIPALNQKLRKLRRKMKGNKIKRKKKTKRSKRKRKKKVKIIEWKNAYRKTKKGKKKYKIHQN